VFFAKAGVLVVFAFLVVIPVGNLLLVCSGINLSMSARDIAPIYYVALLQKQIRFHPGLRE